MAQHLDRRASGKDFATLLKVRFFSQACYKTIFRDTQHEDGVQGEEERRGRRNRPIMKTRILRPSNLAKTKYWIKYVGCEYLATWNSQASLSDSAIVRSTGETLDPPYIIARFQLRSDRRHVRPSRSSISRYCYSLWLCPKPLLEAGLSSPCLFPFANSRGG